MTLRIDGQDIGSSCPPYLIAEISANHNGRIENALALIDAAKQAGATAVKLQTYTPDTITLNCSTADFVIDGGLWGGRTLHDLYAEAHTPWDWHPALFEHARKTGITLFSTPFDKSAVDFLEGLGAPAYKIASFEAIDLPLISYAASTGKPLIISTGMATQEEIGEAVVAARGSGCKELALLHCISAYPAPASEYNLRTIPDLSSRFDCVAGLSDHTLDNATAIASVALGACIIEKHFSLDRSGGGPDDSFSLEPDELAALCRDAQTAWRAIGRVCYERTPSEMPNAKFRRSLYFVKSLRTGEEITPDAVRSVRPGYGLPPKFLEVVVGKKAARDVEFGQPVTTDSVCW
jgi:N-acetylneuraminate synthase